MAFMTTALFEFWAVTVFFPTVERRRQDLAYDGRALFPLDGLGSHHSAKFLRECEARKIEILPLIPHASDQIQRLDVLTFALMKQTFSASRFNQLANPQSNQVVRMLGACFIASASHHHVEAFMSVGLIPVKREERFFLTVVTEKAPRVRGSAALEPAEQRFPPDAHGRFRLPTGI
jgi:hypothetical protein